MMSELRTTNVAPYRRIVVKTMIAAFRDTFNNAYPNERQFQNLKVTQKYPLQKIEYPALVIEYQGRSIFDAGVGHQEWFPYTPTGASQQWLHRRAEGGLSLNIYAESSLDRDIFADSIVEILSFGSLQTQLNTFFNTVYGNPNTQATVLTMLSQIMLNTGEIHEMGNNVSPAPWQPEDSLIYSTGFYLDCHVGFYNAFVQEVEWEYVQNVNNYPYPEFKTNVDDFFSVGERMVDGTWVPPLVFTEPIGGVDSDGRSNIPQVVLIPSGIDEKD